jgi:hypothetical protein
MIVQFVWQILAIYCGTAVPVIIGGYDLPLTPSTSSIVGSGLYLLMGCVL